MKNHSLLILLFFYISFFGQQQELSQEKIKNNVENFLLQKEIDSAKIFLNQLEESDYKKILEKITSKKELTYQEQYQLFSSLSNRTSIKYVQVSNFIDEIVIIPETKKFNEAFFKIKCDQIYNLRDDVSVEKASEKYKELENYLSNFNENDITIQKARLRIQTHPIVLHLIEREVEKGKTLVLDCLEKSENLKDIELQIMFLYHLTDFLVLEGKLQEYIDISEKSLELENQIPKKSPYYHAILQHLIDAYIFKGGYKEKVLLLIDELYSDSTYKIQTYSLYLKLLGRPETDNATRDEILKKFQVNNVKELVDKFQILGKDLNSNDFFKLLLEGSRALEKNEFFKEALAVKDQSILLTRKIYSQDLSKSLADFKIEQTIKTKQKEIEHEQEKNKLYLIIIILGAVFFIISLLIIRKIMNQSKELTTKNKIIYKTLKEKELLIKEVHHRVKNNFNIVASLLELQSQEISDKKTLDLVNEGKNRVKSMALIHQKLYQNDSGLVDFDEYLRLLTKEITSIHTLKDKVITEISSENIFFDVDTAIPLGLIINEIITNAYKYAFSDEKENKLFISIHKLENHYQLIIQDNGSGIPEDFDIKTAKSLGLRLINRLVKQLYGTLNQVNDNGARFEINFKDNYTRKLVN
ncbi:MAG: sensor histidine kinase [Flavobacteriia bacterium]|nr:sensor histidine kinase [Flavobacteriia bacterium]NCT59259.1 sensor histidine kinase [Flavobacteriia bacterium]